MTTDYEPREQTADWLRLVRLHHAVGLRHEGLDWWEDIQSLAKECGMSVEGKPWRLWRDGECVAQWSTLK